MPPSLYAASYISNACNWHTAANTTRNPLPPCIHACMLCIHSPRPCSPSLPPHRWAQHLAGIDFVPTLPVLACQLGAPEQDAVVGGLDAYRRQQRVLTVVQRLRETKQGDSALM